MVELFFWLSGYMAVCLSDCLFVQLFASVTREIQLGDGGIDQKSGADHFYAKWFDSILPQNQFFHRFVQLQRLNKEKKPNSREKKKKLF